MTDLKFRGQKQELPVFIKYLISLAVYLGISLVLLLVGCFIAYSTDDPSSLAGTISYVALYLSVFIAGIVSGRVTGKGAVGSAIVGIAFMLIIFIASLFFENNLKLPIKALLMAAGVAASFLGGIIGRKRSSKNPLKAKYKKLK